MKIIVRNCPKNLKKEVESAVDYYSSCLIDSKRIRNNCTITVNFYRYNVKNKAAFVDIDDYNTKGKPREFSIYLAKEYEEPMLKILAHEMIHIKQYILEEIDDSLEYWKGTFFDRELSSYFEYPWEKEAYEKEDDLYYNFMNRNRHGNEN
jgi:hypothetical protein